MTVFEQRITASPTDIDELGHVNNAAWVRWIQDMATAHWHAAAPPAHELAVLSQGDRHGVDRGFSDQRTTALCAARLVG